MTTHITITTAEHETYLAAMAEVETLREQLEKQQPPESVREALERYSVWYANGMESNDYACSDQYGLDRSRIVRWAIDTFAEK